VLDNLNGGVLDNLNADPTELLDNLNADSQILQL